MPINFNGVSSNTATNNRASETESSRSSATTPVVKDNGSTVAGSSDNVSLSNEAKAFHQLEEQIKKMPVTDQEKVNHFRNAIANGSYQPNPESIATKMLDADNLL